VHLLTRLLDVASERLALLVPVTVLLGVLLPGAGRALVAWVGPLLALLVLATSATIELDVLRRVLRRPREQLVATVLVYVPMPLVALGLAGLLFGEGPLWVGLVLVGALPTDVSSPLLVLLARGNVAFASVANTVNTALSPLLTPLLLVLLTGVALEVPVATLTGQLALVVVAPSVAGIALRAWRPSTVVRLEPLLPGVGALAYLGLLLAAVGPAAGDALADPGRLALVLVGAVALNAAGYALAWLARGALADDGDRTALLFTVSKKEFGIAAVLVASSGIDPAVALPSVVYAVVQMVTSPLVADRITRAGRQRDGAR